MFCGTPKEGRSSCGDFLTHLWLLFQTILLVTDDSL
jgi:hypothetical protein